MWKTKLSQVLMSTLGRSLCDSLLIKNFYFESRCQRWWKSSTAAPVLPGFNLTALHVVTSADGRRDFITGRHRHSCTLALSVVLDLITHLKVTRRPALSPVRSLAHTAPPSGPTSAWIIQPITRLSSLNRIPDWDMLCSLQNVSRYTCLTCSRVSERAPVCVEKQLKKHGKVTHLRQDGILMAEAVVSRP